MHGFLFLLVIISRLLQNTSAAVELQGFVGESVRLQCKKPSSPVEKLYFQQPNNIGLPIFINGFSTGDQLATTIYTNRTKVTQSDLSMELFNLSLADEGDYDCYAFYNLSSHIKTDFNLKIAARYSIPKINVQLCSYDDTLPSSRKCVISCSSSGGFPHSNVTWAVSTGSLLEEKILSVQDEHSKFWNVSQSVSLNCSQTINISCSVGGAVSVLITVCTPDKEVPDAILPIAFSLLLLAIGLIIAFVLITKCRRQTFQEDTSAEMESLNSSTG